VFVCSRSVSLRRLANVVAVIAAALLLTAGTGWPAATPASASPRPAPGPIQSAVLTSSDGVVNDDFGASVAISADGSTAVIGAPQHGSEQTGSAYIFVRRGGSWTQAAELTASDGTRRAMFGSSVAIDGDGDTVVVGAPSQQDNMGAVYVFTRQRTTWTQTAELAPSDLVVGDTFGTSVAVSADGGTTAVGAPAHGTGAAGWVYVFDLQRSGWKQAAELTSSDGVADDFLGNSIAISPDGRAVVAGAVGRNSAVGAAYIFTLGRPGWAQAAELAPTDSTGSDNFGNAVAISTGASTVVIGALGHRSTIGAAYVYSRWGSGWKQTAELAATGGAGGDEFGASVAISADCGEILSSAPGDGADGVTYVFTPQRSGWTQAAVLVPTTTNDDDSGVSVGLTSDGGTALVGSIGDLTSGYGYVFTGLPGH
jgi:FG-GAP repeat